jgi:hypothetical protein
VLFIVSNKVFSVILAAFIEGLRATIAKSKDRASRGDVSLNGPTVIMMLTSFVPVYSPKLLACGTDMQR